MTEEITLEEQFQRLFRVSIKDPEHLKRWLDESGRRWLVFDAIDMVDALPFPDGLNSLIQIIACYRDHRSTKPSGRVEKQADPTLGNEVDVPIMKTDVLEPDEIDRAIRFLVGQITELVPDWDLNNTPL